MTANFGRPSPAMVVAVVALCLAMAGTAIAVGANSIGARELGPVAQRSKRVNIESNTLDTAKVACRRGAQLLGGGAWLPTQNPSEFAFISESAPVGGRKWLASADNVGNTFSATLEVTAICLKQ